VIFVQLLKKFPAFYRKRRYITMVTRAHSWTSHEPDESLIGKGAEL
jgi:hypothetical protein